MRSKATGNLYASSLYFASSVLARQIEKLATEVWKPSGLPPSQGYMLLHILYHSDYSFPFFISRRLLLSPSAVTQLVDKWKNLRWQNVNGISGTGATLCSGDG